ncbi:IS66-like element accessory protein TnpA [Lichenicola sp.]|uniref:IS66-like element accessory protein TnpA n=1 Tax=Lichenicola sp. TaxID=2804529 RepID=UPI003B003640
MVNRADEAATVAATQAASVQRIEIISDRRRAHDPAFRARVVAESYVPGTQVRELAGRHGICTSLVYRWRRERAVAARTGSALRLVPVRVVEEQHPAETQQEPPRPARPSAPRPVAKPALMEIEFPGGVRVRVDETVS